MRWIRLAVLVSVLTKMTVLGVWLWMSPVFVSDAEASGGGEKKAAPAHGEAKPGAGEGAAKAEEKPDEKKDEKKEEKKPEKRVETVMREPEPIAPEVLARSRAFRAMLTTVDEKTGDLRQREQAVAEREATLRALEQTVNAQVARLKALTRVAGGRPAAAPKTADGAAADAASAPPPPTAVSKIYESMKAEEAAPILDRMDDITVRDILSRMKERQIGAILAAMSKDRAVAVTKALAMAGAAPRPAAAP